MSEGSVVTLNQILVHGRDGNRFEYNPYPYLDYIFFALSLCVTFYSRKFVVHKDNFFAYISL